MVLEVDVSLSIRYLFLNVNLVDYCRDGVQYESDRKLLLNYWEVELMYSFVYFGTSTRFLKQSTSTNAIN